MHVPHRRLATGLVLATISLFPGKSAVQAAATHQVAGAGLFSAPTAIAFDLYRDAYIADAASGQVVKLSPAGKPITSWHGLADGALSHPSGLVADAANHVYVTDTGRARLVQYSYAGKRLAFWGAKLKLAGPEAAAIDVSGNVYVADTGNNRIVKVSAKGNLLSSWYGVTPPLQKPKKGAKPGVKPINIGHLLHPQGVTVDYAGHVFVSDSGHDRIVELTSAGIPIHVWGSHGSGAGNLNHPTGLAPDLASNLWIADTGNNRIVHLNVKTGAVTSLGSQGSGDGQLNAPRGVAVDAKGRVYVADTGNHRIATFTAKGIPAGTWG